MMDFVVGLPQTSRGIIVFGSSSIDKLSWHIFSLSDLSLVLSSWLLSTFR